MQLVILSTNIVFLKSKHFWQPAARTASSCHQWHWVNHNTFESCVSVYAEKIYHQRKHLWKDFFGPLFPSPSIIIIFLLPKVPKVHNISQGFVHFYLSTFTCCCHPHASNYLLKKNISSFQGPTNSGYFLLCPPLPVVAIPMQVIIFSKNIYIIFPKPQKSILHLKKRLVIFYVAHLYLLLPSLCG